MTKYAFKPKGMTLIIVILLITFAGCGGGNQLTEKEFNIIWQEYMRREFEESFDEKQSISQKEKILSKLLSEYDVPLDSFKQFVKKNHKDKYKKVFVE